MAFTPYSAKNAKVRFNGSTLYAKKWSVEMDGGNIDISNFEGAGYSDCIAGLADCTVTVDFDHDSTADMFNAPLYLSPGTVGTAARLYLSDTTSPYWSFPSFLVLPLTMGADSPKAAVTGSLKFKNKGTFSPPSGAF